ncbi:MAG: tRNA pseudouridine(38-40) synthase TruA [Lachnospiraceae bacterium]|nr:tRNA pseudouridine(38-40) synthase TruA [Lachnospiraceae bacterium]
MKRIKLVIAYDGTNYCGWQIQDNGVSVEAVLNHELSALLGETVTVIGASRTDSGVHALGNVAVFDTETRIPPEKISYALNKRLPEDIRIQSSEEVNADFHPRHCDSTKIYEYRILNRKFPVPTERLYSYFVYYPLDVEAMVEAARYLVGEHDFISFSSSHTQVLSTVRTIYELSVQKEGDMITIRVRGNGFLYNMVRLIAGTLIRVGLHIYPPEHVWEILEDKKRGVAGPKSPARGLTLVGIEFSEENTHNQNDK